jgi:hypothetical protein
MAKQPKPPMSGATGEESSQGKLLKLPSRHEGLEPALVNLLTHSDFAQALQLARRFVETRYDAAHAPTIQRLETELSALAPQYQASVAYDQRLEKQKQQLKPSVQTSPLLQGKEKASIPFKHWEPKHQVTLITAGALGALVLVAAGVNVYANLVATGLPVFTENSWTAGILSVLLPGGSLVLKFYHNTLPNEYERERYASILYRSAIGLAVAWLVLFSINFHGVSAGIDWNASENNTTLPGILLVAVQMACELAVGGALFVMVETMTALYSTPAFTESAEKSQLDKISRAIREDEENRIRKPYLDKQQELTRLKANREMVIADTLARFESAFRQIHGG